MVLIGIYAFETKSKSLSDLNDDPCKSSNNPILSPGGDALNTDGVISHTTASAQDWKDVVGGDKGGEYFGSFI